MFLPPRPRPRRRDWRRPVFMSVPIVRPFRPFVFSVCSLKIWGQKFSGKKSSTRSSTRTPPSFHFLSQIFRPSFFLSSIPSKRINRLTPSRPGDSFEADFERHAGRQLRFQASKTGMPPNCYASAGSAKHPPVHGGSEGGAFYQRPVWRGQSDRLKNSHRSPNIAAAATA